MFDKKQTTIAIIKNILKAIIAVLVAVIVSVFASNRIKTIGVSLSEQRAAVFLLENRDETMRRLSADFKIVGDSEKKIQNAFPPVENMIDFVDAMEDLADRHSVKQITNFNSLADGNFVDYNINLNANVFALLDYLKDFEQMPYFAGATAVSMSAANGWENNSPATLRGRVYIRRGE